MRVIEGEMKCKRKAYMVGYGINDAPGLEVSSVGVAMGAFGSDIAIETADIALMSDDISKIPELIILSKKVLNTISFNIIISWELT